MVRWGIIVAGQSNAGGQNGLNAPFGFGFGLNPNEPGNPGVFDGSNGRVHPQYGFPEEPDDRVKMVFYGVGNPDPSYGADTPASGFTLASYIEQPLMRAHCPVQLPHAISARAVTFGFHFAKQLVNDPAFPPGDEVVIINTAVHGSGFGFNLPTNFQWEGQQTVIWAIDSLTVSKNLYRMTMDIVKRAVTNHNVVPATVLWLQGEADIHNFNYQSQFFAMIAAMRQELAQMTPSQLRPPTHSTALPFIIGRIKQSEWAGTYSDVAHQQAALLLDNVGIITPREQIIDDGVNAHYSADSHREMGQQMLASFKSLDNAVTGGSSTPTTTTPTTTAPTTPVVTPEPEPEPEPVPPAVAESVVSGICTSLPSQLLMGGSDESEQIVSATTSQGLRYGYGQIYADLAACVDTCSRIAECLQYVYVHSVGLCFLMRVRGGDGVPAPNPEMADVTSGFCHEDTVPSAVSTSGASGSGVYEADANGDNACTYLPKTMLLGGAVPSEQLSIKEMGYTYGGQVASLYTCGSLCGAHPQCLQYVYVSSQLACFLMSVRDEETDGSAQLQPLFDAGRCNLSTPSPSFGSNSGSSSGSNNDGTNGSVGTPTTTTPATPVDNSDAIVDVFQPTSRNEGDISFAANYPGCTYYPSQILAGGAVASEQLSLADVRYSYGDIVASLYVCQELCGTHTECLQYVYVQEFGFCFLMRVRDNAPPEPNPETIKFSSGHCTHDIDAANDGGTGSTPTVIDIVTTTPTPTVNPGPGQVTQTCVPPPCPDVDSPSTPTTTTPTPTTSSGGGSNVPVVDVGDIDCVRVTSPFGPCSVTCGNGQQFRTSVIAVRRSGAGAECAPPPLLVQTCSRPACPSLIECELEYTEWSACSKTCGGGLQSRSYTTPSNAVDCTVFPVVFQACGSAPCVTTSGSDVTQVDLSNTGVIVNPDVVVLEPGPSSSAGTTPTTTVTLLPGGSSGGGDDGDDGVLLIAIIGASALVCLMLLFCCLCRDRICRSKHQGIGLTMASPAKRQKSKRGGDASASLAEKVKARQKAADKAALRAAKKMKPPHIV